VIQYDAIGGWASQLFVHSTPIEIRPFLAQLREILSHAPSSKRLDAVKPVHNFNLLRLMCHMSRRDKERSKQAWVPALAPIIIQRNTAHSLRMPDWR
jgi:hypothetical protein